MPETDAMSTSTTNSALHCWSLAFQDKVVIAVPAGVAAAMFAASVVVATFATHALADDIALFAAGMPCIPNTVVTVAAFEVVVVAAYAGASPCVIIAVVVLGTVVTGHGGVRSSSWSCPMRTLCRASRHQSSFPSAVAFATSLVGTGSPAAPLSLAALILAIAVAFRPAAAFVLALPANATRFPLRSALRALAL